MGVGGSFVAGSLPHRAILRSVEGGKEQDHDPQVLQAQEIDSRPRCHRRPCSAGERAGNGRYRRPDRRRADVRDPEVRRGRRPVARAGSGLPAQGRRNARPGAEQRLPAQGRRHARPGAEQDLGGQQAGPARCLGDRGHQCKQCKPARPDRCRNCDRQCPARCTARVDGCDQHAHERRLQLERRRHRLCGHVRWGALPPDGRRVRPEAPGTDRPLRSGERVAAASNPAEKRARAGPVSRSRQ
jgi:hypothetical protein